MVSFKISLAFSVVFVAYMAAAIEQVPPGKTVAYSEPEPLVNTTIPNEKLTSTTTKLSTIKPPTTSIIPSSSTPNGTVTTTVIPSSTTPNGTDTTTIKPSSTTPNGTVTTTIKPSSTTPNGTDTTTIKPSSTTPNGTVTTTLSPNVTTTPETPSKPKPWDGPSFLSGMVLAFGLVAVGFVGYRFFYLGRGGAYHTL